MRRWAAIAGAALALVAGGCGDDGGSALDRAEASLADVDAGELDLTFSASGEDGPPVGFTLAGPFSWEGEADYPVFDLTYTRLLGEDETENRVVCDGTAMVVVADDEVIEVPEDQLYSLQLGDGSGGLDDFGISGWVEDAEESDGPDGTKVVRGEVDIAELLSDLARVTSQVAGDSDLEAPTGDAADRLRRLVERSDIEIVVDEDGTFRSLTANVDFAAPVSADLRRTLGRYASAKLVIELRLVPLDGELKVTLPA